MSTRADLSNFYNSPLFAGLNKDQIEVLSRSFTATQFNAGKVIFIENMTGESLYLIKRGTVVISQMLAEADEQNVVELTVGDTFGEMAVVDEGLRAVTARVTGDAELYALSRQSFMQLAEEDADLALALALNLLRIISNRLRQAKSDYRNMLLATLERRKA